MRPRARIDGLLVLRPLLGLRRASLRQYAGARGLPWGEDSTNEDISLARNRLRRRMLSDLQQIHPAAVENVARAARLMQQEEDWLDEHVAGLAAALVVEEDYPGARALSVAGLAELARPLQRRVVRHVIAGVRGHCRGIAYEHVEWVIDNESATARDLPGVRVIKEQDRVRFLPLSGRRLATPGRG
jgi:tRNA(Ile)-lysidine synthase